MGWPSSVCIWVVDWNVTPLLLSVRYLRFIVILDEANADADVDGFEK